MLYEELRLEVQAYRIFTAYPDLDTACTAVINFVGLRFPGKSEPLSREMIKSAFDRYKQAELGEANPRHEFVRGLCAPAIFLYKVRYCAGEKDITAVWRPMAQSVTSFEHSHPEITVFNDPDPQHVNEQSATQLFAARILQSHLFLEVFQRGENHVEAH